MDFLTKGFGLSCNRHIALDKLLNAYCFSISQDGYIPVPKITDFTQDFIQYLQENNIFSIDYDTDLVGVNPNIAKFIKSKELYSGDILILRDLSLLMTEETIQDLLSKKLISLKFFDKLRYVKLNMKNIETHYNSLWTKWGISREDVETCTEDEKIDSLRSNCLSLQSSFEMQFACKSQ